MTHSSTYTHDKVCACMLVGVPACNHNGVWTYMHACTCLSKHTGAQVSEMSLAVTFRINHLLRSCRSSASTCGHCLVPQKPTALAKILGVYRIGYRNTQTNAALKQDLLVMENLFYNRDITQVGLAHHKLVYMFLVISSTQQ